VSGEVPDQGGECGAKKFSALLKCSGLGTPSTAEKPDPWQAQYSHGHESARFAGEGDGARGSNTSPQLRLERGRPQRAIIPILERHGHDLGRSIDRDIAKKLKAVTRRLVRRAGCLHVNDLRSECVVERILWEAS